MSMSHFPPDQCSPETERPLVNEVNQDTNRSTQGYSMAGEEPDQDGQDLSVNLTQSNCLNTLHHSPLTTKECNFPSTIIHQMSSSLYSICQISLMLLVNLLQKALTQWNLKRHQLFPPTIHPTQIPPPRMWTFWALLDCLFLITELVHQRVHQNRLRVH